MPGSPGDPSRIAELAAAGDDGFYPALQSEGLLVLPASEVWHRGRLRGVECATTDPVSIALADGAATASFPDLRGWSASDCARRALAEQRGWLGLDPVGDRSEVPFWARGSARPELTELAGLFAAARAALFADALEAGAPEIALTAAAIATRMAEYGQRARTATEAAYESLAACRGALRPPDQRCIQALREAVRTLPAYGRGASCAAQID